MTALVPATLQRLTVVVAAGKDSDAKVRTDGEPLEVQFNPVSMRLTRNNNVDRGGVTTQTQKRRHPSQEAAKLSFDLEFDTAEQVAGGRHTDVRDWTALVRQFVEPPRDKPDGPPPAVRFAWGTLVFDGIIEQVTEELDYFAPDGTPLHAKISVSIGEQNFRYEANVEGPGRRDARKAVDPGQGATRSGPGSSGTDRTDQVVPALAGESAQQLLTRLGLDPTAWRSAMTGLDSPLSLPAGTPVQLGPAAAGGGGPGQSAAFTAGPVVAAPADLASALGLGGSTAAPAGGQAPADGAASGFALTSAGGVTAAAATVLGAAAAEAAAAERAAFAVPDAAGQPGQPGQPGRPGRPRQSGRPSQSGQLGPSGPSGPAVDPRALSYGQGIPLRARAAAATAADAAWGGSPSLTDLARPARAAAADPSAPPWERREP